MDYDGDGVVSPRSSSSRRWTWMATASSQQRSSRQRSAGSSGTSARGRAPRAQAREGARLAEVAPTREEAAEQEEEEAEEEACTTCRALQFCR